MPIRCQTVPAARGDFNGGLLSECIGRDHPLYLENYLGELLIIADDMPPLSDTERGPQEGELSAASRVLRST